MAPTRVTGRLLSQRESVHHDSARFCKITGQSGPAVRSNLKLPRGLDVRGENFLTGGGLAFPSFAAQILGSLPTNAGQQPSNYALVRIAPAALNLVLLDGALSKCCGLFSRLSLVLWKRHPLANDLPARLVVFHVCSSLGLGNLPPWSASRD
jgi:hypothetical protein